MLHMPQKHKATVSDSTLRMEMNALEEQADNAKARELHWKPLSWLGTIRPTTPNDAWDQPLWETFVCTTLGLEVPVLTSLPRRNQRAPALCSCKKHGVNLHGDYTSTCTAHSGAKKAHDWAVGVLGPLFRSAGHLVRTQHGVTASAGQRRGDVEIKATSGTQRAAGAWSSTCPSHTTDSEAAATCSRKVCCRIPRTSTHLSVSLHSARSIAIDNNTLTTRTFLFSPPL